MDLGFFRSQIHVIISFATPKLVVSIDALLIKIDLCYHWRRYRQNGNGVYDAVVCIDLMATAPSSLSPNRINELHT